MDIDWLIGGATVIVLVGFYVRRSRPVVLNIGRAKEEERAGLHAEIRKAESGMPSDIREAHRHCFKNREELLRSDLVGCFFCLHVFPPTEIHEWHDDDQTGFCPKCFIDALIGSASGRGLTPEFLQTMNRHWFGTEGSTGSESVRIAAHASESGRKRLSGD